MKNETRNSKNRLYVMWNNMKSRCNNKNNQDYLIYGGRGIKLCEEWENDSLAFMKWARNNRYSDTLTIERIDVNKGYSPNNCEFIPNEKQALNRRVRVDNKFGVAGINFDERKQKFITRVTIDGERYYVGAYDSIEDAINGKRNYMTEKLSSGIIKQLKEDEGYSKHLYKCTMNKTSIGYGTNLEVGLSKAEAELLLSFRLNQTISRLLDAKPIILRLPLEKQEILFNMAYQLGVNGLLNFKMMWLALENFKYNEASVEMIDSLWAKQTPNRANKLAEQMKS